MPRFVTVYNYRSIAVLSLFYKFLTILDFFSRKKNKSISIIHNIYIFYYKFDFLKLPIHLYEVIFLFELVNLNVSKNHLTFIIYTDIKISLFYNLCNLIGICGNFSSRLVFKICYIYIYDSC